MRAAATSWVLIVFKVVAADPPPIRTVTDFTIDTPYRLDALADADTIVVPGWSDPDVPSSAELAAALGDAYTRGARIVSICIGAFVLAEAGLLDGRSATTHWAYVDRFRARFPRVRLDPRVSYVDDGQILTSAGTAAGMDLCLHLVRLDHGAQVANGVARMVVMPPHREGGQAQYIDQPIAAPGRGSEIHATLEWALARLHEPLSVDRLAEHALMSPRTFARRFGQVGGTTPGEWLTEQRVNLAPSDARDDRPDHRLDRPPLRLRVRNDPPTPLQPAPGHIPPRLPVHIPRRDRRDRGQLRALAPVP